MSPPCHISPVYRGYEAELRDLGSYAQPPPLSAKELQRMALAAMHRNSFRGVTNICANDADNKYDGKDPNSVLGAAKLPLSKEELQFFAQVAVYRKSLLGGAAISVGDVGGCDEGEDRDPYFGITNGSANDADDEGEGGHRNHLIRAANDSVDDDDEMDDGESRDSFAGADKVSVYDADGIDDEEDRYSFLAANDLLTNDADGFADGKWECITRPTKMAFSQAEIQAPTVRRANNYLPAALANYQPARTKSLSPGSWLASKDVYPEWFSRLTDPHASPFPIAEEDQWYFDNPGDHHVAQEEIEMVLDHIDEIERGWERESRREKKRKRREEGEEGEEKRTRRA